MKKQFLLTTTVAGLLAISAQGTWAQNVAVVNGKAVPASRVDVLMKQVAQQNKVSVDQIGADQAKQLRDQLREEVIAREVFMQEAEKKGLASSEDYKIKMETARQAILISELFMDYQKKNPVPEGEMKAEYEKYVAANGGKEYKARHILVEKEDDAKAIIANLKKGAKFEDIAKKQSKDPGSGAKGGDLDWASPANYVKEFADALKGLNKGQLSSAPVKTQFGYHVIRVDDIREAQLPSFEEVKPQIEQQMQQNKLAAYKEDLRKKAKVE